tara:strand:+ start:169 stop:681 length:513 start_codon:yes stop_codon:yes gene_type:complete
MIWLNLKKLERLLIQNKITESISYQYLLVFLVMLTLASTFPEKDDFSHYGWKVAFLILELLITIVGTYLVFQVNEKGDNRDFLKRYFSLSFVNGLRLVLLAVFIRLVFKVIMFVIPLDLWNTINDFFMDSGEFFFDIILSIVFYVLLLASFKKVNAGRNEQEVAVQSDLK